MANRYFISGGTGNYNSTTNWSDTSGGAGGFSVPSASDDVYLDAASGANTLTINVSSVAKSITCTGFIGTLAGSSTFVISGNVTLASSMSITYSGIMTINANSTFTSNTKIITWHLRFQSNTVTLADDLYFNGNQLTLSVASSTATINGNNIYVQGGIITCASNASVVAGTSVVRIVGTVSLNATVSNTYSIPIVFDSGANTVTINCSGSNILRLGNNGSITYTSGFVNTSNANNVFLTTSTSNYTFDTNGMTWKNITLESGTKTVTLNSLLRLSGDLVYNSGTIITFAGSAGWETSNFYILTSNNISHTLVSGLEYKVNTYFESIATTSSLKDSLISSIPGSKAIFTLAYGATQNVGFTNAVDIDSSRGQTIWSYNGTITTTNNWQAFTSNFNSRKYIF